MGRPKGSKNRKTDINLPKPEIVVIEPKPIEPVVKPVVELILDRHVSLYTRDDVKAVELTTDLRYAGFMNDDYGIRIPVFLKNPNETYKVARMQNEG